MKASDSFPGKAVHVEEPIWNTGRSVGSLPAKMGETSATRVARETPEIIRRALHVSSWIPSFAANSFDIS